MVCDRRVFKLSPRPSTLRHKDYLIIFVSLVCLGGAHLCAEPVSGELPQTATPVPAHRRILPLPGAAAAASPHFSSSCPLLPRCSRFVRQRVRRVAAAFPVSPERPLLRIIKTCRMSCSWG